MLRAINLSYSYGKGFAELFTDFSLTLVPGEIVGMTGPSGRGKTTIAKILAGYLLPKKGRVMLDGGTLPAAGYCPVQLLLQHPELAVNPRWRIKKILSEAGEEWRQDFVDYGIEESWFDRYPHELSGGELQRVCLLRALGEQTRFLVCDEMTAMLDSVTQAYIWKKVLEIQERRKLGLLVISHDETLLKKLCHRQIVCP